MAQLTYEFANLPASKEYQENTAIARPAFEISKAKTSHPIWIGLHRKEPHFWNVTAWDSIEAHKEFQSSPEYKTFFDRISPALLDPAKANPEIKYVHFDRDPSGALSAPMTEIAELTPKENSTRADVESIVKGLFETLNDDGSNGSPGKAIGSIEGDSNKLFIILGWENDELHREWAKPDGPARELIMKARAAAEFNVNEVKFSAV